MQYKLNVTSAFSFLVRPRQMGEAVMCDLRDNLELALNCYVASCGA